MDKIKSLISIGFAAHCPGGIDWGVQTHLPQTCEDLRVPTRYPYYGVLYFDFHQNTRIIWGENFRPTMPTPVEVQELALPALRLLLAGLDNLPEYANVPRRWANAAYHAIVTAQAVFGEATLDKTRMLSLYLRNVPDFDAKIIGELTIREYLGSFYPDRPPRLLEHGLYRRLIIGLIDVVAAQA